MDKHDSKHSRNRKHIPYGSTKKKFWCPCCDRVMVNAVSKKSERQKVKKQLNNMKKAKDYEPKL